MAALAAIAIGWFAFVANSPVPVLDLFDLGIHETGHLVAAFMPETVMFIAGSVAQVAVPLALAWYFGIRRGDAAGGAFCLAWTGTSLWDVSVYIADAPVQALPLVGGGQHDWAHLLGPSGWDAMHLADEIAAFVEFTGGALAVIGAATAIWAAVDRVMAGDDDSHRLVHPVTPIDSGVDRWEAASELPFYHQRDE